MGRNNCPFYKVNIEMSTEVILDKVVDNSLNVIQPKKYKVIFLNDDVTPAEFVIALMIKIFRHNEDIAKEITLKIHNEGSGVAGIYTYEIAEQKSLESTAFAQLNQYPLENKIEPE